MQIFDGSPPRPLPGAGLVPGLDLELRESAGEQGIEILPGPVLPFPGGNRQKEAPEYGAHAQRIGESRLRFLRMRASDSPKPPRFASGQEARFLGPAGQSLVVDESFIRGPASRPVDGVDEIEARVAAYEPEGRLRTPGREAPAGSHGRKYSIRNSGQSGSSSRRE